MLRVPACPQKTVIFGALGGNRPGVALGRFEERIRLLLVEELNVRMWLDEAVRHGHDPDLEGHLLVLPSVYVGEQVGDLAIQARRLLDDRKGQVGTEAGSAQRAFRPAARPRRRYERAWVGPFLCEVGVGRRPEWLPHVSPYNVRAEGGQREFRSPIRSDPIYRVKAV